jgi:hypothetical protein
MAGTDGNRPELPVKEERRDTLQTPPLVNQEQHENNMDAM